MIVLADNVQVRPVAGVTVNPRLRVAPSPLNGEAVMVDAP